MKSIEEIKKIINWKEAFYIQKTLNNSQIDRFLNSIRINRETTIRINTLKITKQEALSELNKKNIKFSNFPLLENAFIIKELKENDMLKVDLVKEGKIYLQSLSSQIPPIVLDPQSGEYILDLAASPGSKTGQIASIMKNSGKIDAIEVDFIRKERLIHNLNLLGVTNTTVYQERGEIFLKDVENRYDRVLLDAPCSGEGRFNINDKQTYSNYNKNLVEKLSRLQIKMLEKALQAVKPGGIVVYSTCTLNYLENEFVVTEAAKNFQCKVEKFEEKFYELTEYISPLKEIENITFRKDIINALKYLPSNKMEGFFIAKIVKL